MKSMLRLAAVASVLSLGAANAALAQLVLPNTGNSTAVLSILDSAGQRSLTIGLDADLASLLPSILATEAGFSITNALRASDRTDVANFLSVSGTYSWWISAADSQFGATSQSLRGFATTGDVGISVAPPFGITASALVTMTNNAQTFFNNVNTVCGTDNTCAGISGESTYAGTTIWGDRYGGQLNPALGNGAAVGTAQGFYYFATPDNANAGTAVQRTAYGNSAGAGSWLLSVISGEAVLSYSLAPAAPVPLPAAAWLLISGLLGFATVARRKQQSAVVAA